MTAEQAVELLSLVRQITICIGVGVGFFILRAIVTGR